MKIYRLLLQLSDSSRFSQRPYTQALKNKQTAFQLQGITHWQYQVSKNSRFVFPEGNINACKAAKVQC